MTRVRYHHGGSLVSTDFARQTVASASSRSLGLAWIVVFSAFWDLFSQQPVIATLARDLGANALMQGWTVGIYSLCNLFGNVVAGVLLDRFDRVRILRLGMAGVALAACLCALATTPTLLLLSRCVHGMAAAVLTPGAFAIIGDAAPRGERGKAMGKTGALICVAAILAPPIAGSIRDTLGASAVFFITAGLMGAILVVSAGHTTPRAATTMPRTPLSLRALLTQPTLGAANAAALGMTVALGVIVTQLPLLVEAHGGKMMHTGMALAAYAFVSLVLMSSPIVRFSDRHGRRTPVLAGLCVIAAALVCLSLAGTYVQLIACLMLFGVGFGLVFPAATAWVTDATDAHSRGEAFGIFYAVYSLGVAGGSIGSGAVVHHFANRGDSALLGAAVVCSFGFLVFWLTAGERAPQTVSGL